MVHYLGHIISEDGIATDPEKVRVAEWPTPTGMKDLQKFLGLASYYRKFIKNFAQIAAPLHHLTEQNKKYCWTAECENALNTLKHCLTTSPLLAFPRFDVEFTLDCDASSEGLGAVLSQMHDGREHVISYASRSLIKAECHYCTTRRELLALVWGCRQFRQYLYGTHFTVRTDHNALKWLKNFKEPEGQVARWLQILSEYDFQVEHRPGKQHLNADALSRNHCRQCGSEQSKTAESHHTSVLTVSTPEQESWLPTWNIDDFRL